MRIIEIRDLAAQELDIYARMSENQLAHIYEPDIGLFIAESPNVIQRALNAGYEPVSILIEKKQLDRWMQKESTMKSAMESMSDQIDLPAGNNGDPADVVLEHIMAIGGDIPVYTAEYEVLKKLTGFALIRGLLCAMRRKVLPSPEVVCSDAHRIAVLENVMNPINVGAIFRSAAALGMDAVLLSGFAKVKPGERALDLGTGTGIIPILLEAKTKGEHFTGLEIQPESADMAARSVAYNHLEEKITIVTGDIKEASARFGAGSFEVITTNPPYMIGQHGIQNDANAKTIARHEVLCDLDDILRESAKMLKQGGRFYMVHRPFRLAEIFSKMVAYHIEPKRMRLVYPFVDKEPNMVLIEGLRGGKSRLTVEKPLIVYKEPGVYMPEIYDIYGY